MNTSPDFPEEFMKGVGMSVWQNSSDGADVTDAANVGNPSNWYHYAKSKKFFNQRQYASAWHSSNDFWNLYEKDIKLAKETLGTNSFRFSFEWSRLEPPGAGMVDQAAVARYHEIIDCIIANGMEPMCTLHHFTHPQWFEDMGGFTREENIPVFVAYCKRVFTWFSPKIKLWATFNEPTCFSFVGFIVGLWCPGKMFQFTEAGKVLLVLLKAHVAAYKALKALPNGQQTCIGLVNQHIRFMPKSRYTPHANLLCKWMTYWFASEVILKFFMTGVFDWKAPFCGTVVHHICREAPETLDWWGINYYSSPCVGPFFGLGASNAKEPVSDIGFRMYPKGLYDSIADASTLKVPMYITETGWADKEGKQRRQFIDSHCDMIVKAIRDGYDVRGMYYWTLMDNIEWHEGFHVKYGLFEWDPETCRSGKGMRLRPGSDALKERYTSWPDKVVDMRIAAGDLRVTDVRLDVADRPMPTRGLMAVCPSSGSEIIEKVPLVVGECPVGH